MSDKATTYEKCRHFTGIQNVCGAGIDPKTVRDESGTGPYRWPCLQLIGRAKACDTCPKREWMTAEDHAAHRREADAAVERITGLLAAGKCHVCEKPIEPSKIIGRCKYGACGHRIGQVETGDADLYTETESTQAGAKAIATEESK